MAERPDTLTVRGGHSLQTTSRIVLQLYVSTVAHCRQANPHKLSVLPDYTRDGKDLPLFCRPCTFAPHSRFGPRAAV